MVGYTCGPSTWPAEQGDGDFEAGLSYMMGLPRKTQTEIQRHKENGQERLGISLSGKRKALGLVPRKEKKKKKWTGGTWPGPHSVDHVDLSSTESTCLCLPRTGVRRVPHYALSSFIYFGKLLF